MILVPVEGSDLDMYVGDNVLIICQQQIVDWTTCVQAWVMRGTGRWQPTEEMTRRLLEEILSVDPVSTSGAMPLCDGDFSDVVPEMLGLSSRTLVGMMASREDAAFEEV